MDFVRSYFGTNEPLTRWTLFSSPFDWFAVWPVKKWVKVFNWSDVHLYRSNFLQNPYFNVPVVCNLGICNTFLIKFTHLHCKWQNVFTFANEYIYHFNFCHNRINSFHFSWVTRYKMHMICNFVYNVYKIKGLTYVGC